MKPRHLKHHTDSMNDEIKACRTQACVAVILFPDERSARISGENKAQGTLMKEEGISEIQQLHEAFRAVYTLAMEAPRAGE